MSSRPEPGPPSNDINLIFNAAERGFKGEAQREAVHREPPGTSSLTQEILSKATKDQTPKEDLVGDSEIEPGRLTAIKFSESHLKEIARNEQQIKSKSYLEDKSITASYRSKQNREAARQKKCNRGSTQTSNAPTRRSLTRTPPSRSGPSTGISAMSGRHAKSGKCPPTAS